MSVSGPNSVLRRCRFNVRFCRKRTRDMHRHGSNVPAVIAAIRRTDVTEYWPGLPRQSALMLAATITLPHLLVSSEMSLPKSADDPESAVRLRPFLRHCHEASSSSKALAFFRSSVSKPSVNQL